MTVTRSVYKIERIVPVRFTRSPVAAPANTYTPDIDDRGFSRYHGPVVGVSRGDRAQVRVLRDLVDQNATLFVTSEDASKVTIAPASTQLANGAEAELQFTAGNTDGECKIQVRAQALNGPIVAELTVQVSQLIRLRCAVHRAAIYTPPVARDAANTTARTLAEIRTLMAELNNMWRPMGIEFTITDEKDDTNLTNQVAINGVNPTNGSGASPFDGFLLCPEFGHHDAAGNEVLNQNFDLMMNTNFVASRLNLYFMRGIRSASPGGGAGPNYAGFGNSHFRGLVIADNIGNVETTAHTIAHELAHILTLAAMGHTNRFDSHSDDAPQWNISTVPRRHDLWSRRRLMYYMVGLQAVERTGPGGRYSFDGTDVGHGAGNSGHMLTIKNLANQGDPTDNEYTDARTQATALKNAGNA